MPDAPEPEPASIADCHTCRGNADPDLPVREALWHTPHWRVAHAFDTSLPGWLVLLPSEHVLAAVDLSPAAAAELGPLLRDVSRALHEVTGCAKTYLMQFSEAPGFAHLHVHVVARMPDQPDAWRGPGIFAALGVPEQDQVSEQDRDALAVRLHAALRG